MRMGFRYGLVMVLLVEGGVTSVMEGTPSDGRRSYGGRPLPARRRAAHGHRVLDSHRLGRNKKGVLTPGRRRDRPASLVNSPLALPIHINIVTQHFPKNFFRNFWRDVSHGEHAWPVSAPHMPARPILPLPDLLATRLSLSGF